MDAALALEIGGILLCGSLAILGIETKRPLLTVLFKPLTTAILFLVVRGDAAARRMYSWTSVLYRDGGLSRPPTNERA